MTMNKTCRTIAVATIFAASALMAGCAIPERPSIEMSDVSEVTGRVVALHRGQRIVSLRGSEGNVVTFKVDQAVRNFDQVRVGDEVKLQFYESVAIFVTSDGKPPAADGAVAVAVAPKGARPGGEVVEVTEVSATIQAINPVRRVLTYFSAGGPRGVDVTRFDPNEVALNARETEILQRVAKGYTLPEIAGQLGLSRHTVADYVKQIYRKLNVSSRAEAALEAARRGLVRP